MTIYVNYRKIKIFTLITATGLRCFIYSHEPAILLS